MMVFLLFFCKEDKILWVNLKKGFSKYRKQPERSFIIGRKKLDGVNEVEISKDIEEDMGYCSRITILKTEGEFFN